MASIYTNEVYFIELIVTDLNGRVSGLSISYDVYRSSDDVKILSGLLTDIGNGIYKTGVSIDAPGQYRVECTTPTGFEDDIKELLVTRSDFAEQTDFSGATLNPSSLIDQCGSNYSYSIFDNTPPGYMSGPFTTIKYENVGLIVKTTGRVDIFVSNDRNNWVTHKNVYDYFTGNITGFGYIKLLTVDGFSTASICLSGEIKEVDFVQIV